MFTLLHRRKINQYEDLEFRLNPYDGKSTMDYLIFSCTHVVRVYLEDLEFRLNIFNRVLRMSHGSKVRVAIGMIG